MNLSKRDIYTIVALVGGYVFFQALADVAATRLVQIAGLVMPAGTFVYAATFTLRDLIHKRLGATWARAAIWTAGALNLVMALYLDAMGALPSPAYYQLAGPWSDIFALVSPIVVASILAEVWSELVDTRIYQFMVDRFSCAEWGRVLISNAIALPLDSLLFIGLAFLLLPLVLGREGLAVGLLPGLIGGQIVGKLAVTLVTLPAIYLVRYKQVRGQ